MSRLPPVDKLPMALRKDIRDNWDSKKPELEQKISELLGTAWTIDINPNQIYAYAQDGYGKEATGSMLENYVSSAESRLRDFVNKYGEDGKKELNTTFSAHVITMDLDVNKKFSYCGCEVSPTGQLVILFAENNLAVNIDHALYDENLTKALNEVPPAAGSMNYVARKSIKTQYDAEIGEVQSKVNELLGKPITLNPNFQAVFDKLNGASDVDKDWAENLGQYIKFYFEALSDWLRYNKVAEDEMVREGLLELVSSDTVVFRVVDDGQLKDSYNECVIEDGVLYLQTNARNWGVNTSKVADKLMDLL